MTNGWQAGAGPSTADDRRRDGEQQPAGARVPDAPATSVESADASGSARAPVAAKRTLLLRAPNGVTSRIETRAATVAELLHERGITCAAGDVVSPAPTAPLHDGMVVEYRPAVAVTVIDGARRRELRTALPTVGALLASERIAVGPHDRVFPQPGIRLSPGDIVRVIRVRAWTSRIRERIAATIERRPDPSLLSGTTRVISQGRAGERELTVRYTQTGNGAAIRNVIASHVIRAPKPRIVARGIAEYAALAQIAQRGFEGTLHLAKAALSMLASAYTAGCSGCSGWTALGMRAGHGVVAVDPRVIPLGTKLFIPGYGRAVAGDTGGAIVGRRIDLGFDSLAAAERFGLRPVTVYVLR